MRSEFTSYNQFDYSSFRLYERKMSRHVSQTKEKGSKPRRKRRNEGAEIGFFFDEEENNLADSE